MVFGFSRKDARENEGPSRQKRVPYRLASYEHDVEGKKFKTGNVVYSFWSASKYVLILSLMLWWLPMFGQMIAGYVGGRRAGGPWKGVAASIIPVVAIWGVITGFETGILPSHIFGVAVAPAAVGAFINSDVPFLAPYFQFSSDYVGGFVQGLADTSPYGINYYVLTVAFAYVGGVLAAQNRREIEFTSGAVMNTTTVLVHDPNGSQQEVAEQQAAPRGFLGGVTALLHLPGGHGDRDATKTGIFAGRRHGNPWGHATEMHYEDAYDDPRGPYALPPGDFEESRSGGMMASRPQRMRRQKRRGAQNFNAKPRFNYPQYSYSQRQEPGYKGGMIRRAKAPTRFVSPDPHSIKRAQKQIDNEWRGGHRSHGAPRFADDYPAAEETEAVAIAAPRRRENHGNQWDSI